MKRIMLFTILCATSVRTMAQEKKAYGGINFGASRYEYYQELDSATHKIGDYDFNFLPTFYKDSLLTGLDIHSKIYPSDQFDDAQGALSALYEVISKQYGSSKFLYLLRYNSLKVGEKGIYAFWEIGEKRVHIGLMKLVDGNVYAYCSMWNQKISDRIYKSLKTNNKEQADKF